MVASRWVLGLLGSAAILSTSSTTAQELPPIPILLAQSEQKTDADILFDEGWTAFEKGTAEGYQQAIEKWEEALILYEQQQNDEKIALTNLALGFLHSNLGYKEQSLNYYQQSLTAYRKINDRRGEATILTNIGRVYSALGEKEEALAYYEEALPLLRAVGNRNFEAALFNNFGGLLQEEQPELAIIFYKQSVNIYETLRKDIEQLDSDIQQTYLSTIEDTYRRLADLLLQENRVFEAQRVLDLLKVQELDGIFGNVQVRSGSDLGIFHRSPEADFLERYNDQLRKEIALGAERTKLIALSQTVGLTDTQTQRFRELERLQNSASSSLQAFINRDDIQQLISELRANFAENDPTIDLNQRADLREILQSLEQQGQKAAFLYPFILGDRLELVLITSSTNAISRSVKISRTELNQLIINAGTALKDRNSVNSDYTALEELHEVLITPIEAALDEAGIQTIVYAPDGALRYIPLAALRNKAEQNWLIDKYQVNNITALSLKTFGRNAPQRLNIFAGAFASGKHNIDVEVSDGKSQKVRREPFTGLTYAGKEVEAIAQVAQTTTKIDGEFSSDIVQDFNLYTVIHLATHAKFLPATPRDSFMVFGNGEYLSLRQMEEEHLEFGNAPIENKWQLTQQQLVVLSACETALGSDLDQEKLKETNSGIEILGLGYQWQRQGARATMASLWQVQDDSTQVLMTEFYRNLGKGNISSAEALRQAQTTLSQDPTYAHPYHWASFVLIGNGL
ncbi:MAG: CHAT domain-containing protein [Limnothrix sp. RL_2_0]|nr:CHAT domain-containing protein [Limnothrix sp. RL_2_0]